MDSSSVQQTAKLKDAVLEKTLPQWTCELLPLDVEPGTVGQIKTLKCSGFDFLPIEKKYSLKLDEKDEHALKILSVKTDSQSVKSFHVTSYKAVKGDLKIILKGSGEELFVSVVRGLNMKSVVKNPQDPKPIGPHSGAYALPGTTELVFMGITVLAIMAILALRGIRRVKKVKEFKRVVSKARYADPFMDFNIELRDYAAQKNVSVLFLGLLDDSFNKLFFRVFEENVSLDNLPALIRSLKGLGMEPHEIRSFYVLEEEYKKFKALYTEKKGEIFIEKKEFLDQAKKAIYKLKVYMEAQR